MHYALAISN